jgi:Restriction endonuclease BamHI
MNKLTMLVSRGIISAGVLAVPSRKLYVYLTDRIGNIRELEPYFSLWKSVPCKSGVLEIVVFEHDAESESVKRIPKLTSGRALG